MTELQVCMSLHGIQCDTNGNFKREFQEGICVILVSALMSTLVALFIALIFLLSAGANPIYAESIPIPEWMIRWEFCEKGDRTFFDGEWYFLSDKDGNQKGPYRHPLVYAIRLEPLASGVNHGACWDGMLLCLDGKKWV